MFAFGAQSQIDFYKRYNGNGYDYGNGAVELPDTSYMICGSSTSFLNGAPQAYLMKLDSMGNHLWSKNYGGLETETAQRVFFTPGDGFYVAGHMNTTPTGDFNFYFFHTDTEGELLWEKNYGTDSWEILNDAIKLEDSSYILVGETFGTADGEKDGYIVRLDKFGDTLWTKNSGHIGEDVFNDVLNFYDTSFVVGGQAWNSDSSMLKSYMACYKMDGTLIWENQYGSDGNYVVNTMEKHNGYIIGVGARISPIDNLGDDYVIKVDDQGDYNYGFSYHQPGMRSYDFIKKFGGPDDFYMSYSNDNISTTGPGQDTYIGHFDEFVSFQNTGIDVDGSHDDLVGEIIPTSDSGALVVGTNHNVVFEIPSVFVMKIGNNQTYPPTQPAPSAIDILYINENSIKGVEVKIYPNPTHGILNISLNKFIGEGTIIFTDITGKEAMVSEILSEFTEVNLENLEKGMYFINLQLESGNIKSLGKISLK